MAPFHRARAWNTEDCEVVLRLEDAGSCDIANLRADVVDIPVALGTLVRSVVPELDEASAQRFAATTVLVAGSLWAYSRPSAAMLAAYEADPALAAMRLDFGDAVRDLLATLIAGLLARPA